MTVPYYEADGVTLYVGDCLDVLGAMPDASVHAVVTDPPYGLAFMGKRWDYDVPSVEVWREVLRVLKPGGHLLSFGGTRTYHRMVVAIEDAGFEVRDQLAWLFGSGFPKSLDVSKAIDKSGGASPEAQSRVLREARIRSGLTQEEVVERVGCTPSSVRDWEVGRARAVGRAVEFITPSPQYRDALADLLGYTADERRIAGARIDRRGDGTVIGLGHSGVEYGAPATDAAREWAGWGTALKPAHEPIVLARKPLGGTVAANVLEHGTGALNIDGCRIAFRSAADEAETKGKTRHADFGSGARENIVYNADSRTRAESGNYDAVGRWPTNVLLDEIAAEMLDVQSDGASRFYYTAKASRSDRGRGNNHPTVKPVDLMRRLVRLVTPPGGVVLDPFMGSGSTGVAAVVEGIAFVGVEREAEYAEIARRRIANAPLPLPLEVA